MKKLIKAHKPDLIIKVAEDQLERFGHTPSSIFSFLEPYGYTCQQIGKENNYLFLVKEKNYLFQEIGVLRNQIWVEWIGIWGSGKTTCINNISKSLESSGYKFNTTATFFSNNRSVKFYKVLKLRLMSVLIIKIILKIKTNLLKC